MQSVIHALLNLNHSYASITKIFNFLWRIWKARSVCLFERNCTSPFQVYHAVVPITHTVATYFDSSDYSISNAKQHTFLIANLLLEQGCTVTVDLLISWQKIIQMLRLTALRFQDCQMTAQRRELEFSFLSCRTIEVIKFKSKPLHKLSFLLCRQKLALFYWQLRWLRSCRLRSQHSSWTI